jgi:hypothetical protein
LVSSRAFGQAFDLAKPFDRRNSRSVGRVCEVVAAQSPRGRRSGDDRRGAPPLPATHGAAHPPVLGQDERKELTMMNRFSKIAAVATIALGAAAPMVMADAFQTGTVTAVNHDRDTVAINGATYKLRGNAAATAKLGVGEQVLYKADRDDATPQLVALRPAPVSYEADSSINVVPFHALRVPMGLSQSSHPDARSASGTEAVGIGGDLSVGGGGGLGSQNH